MHRIKSQSKKNVKKLKYRNPISKSNNIKKIVRTGYLTNY